MGDARQHRPESSLSVLKCYLPQPLGAVPMPNSQASPPYTYSAARHDIPVGVAASQWPPSSSAGGNDYGRHEYPAAMPSTYLQQPQRVDCPSRDLHHQVQLRVPRGAHCEPHRGTSSVGFLACVTCPDSLLSCLEGMPVRPLTAAEQQVGRRPRQAARRCQGLGTAGTKTRRGWTWCSG